LEGSWTSVTLFQKWADYESSSSVWFYYPVMAMGVKFIIVLLVLFFCAYCTPVQGFRFHLLGVRPSLTNRTALTAPHSNREARQQAEQRQLRASKRGTTAETQPTTADPGVERLPRQTIQASEPLHIIISGAPASGKGTQCEKIASKFGVLHLSTGEMLRAAMRANTPLGSEVRAYMEQSKLVPDDIMIRVVNERLSGQDCLSRGWILDGYPRTRKQAEDLLNSGVKPDVFILLDVPQDVLLERVVGRRSDPVTGKIYHMKHHPPESPEVAQRLVQRLDDTVERTKRRIRDYQTYTQSVRSYFEDVLVTVNGSASRDDITKTIFTALGKLRRGRVADGLAPLQDRGL
jgi:adenylate kinase